VAPSQGVAAAVSLVVAAGRMVSRVVSVQGKIARHAVSDAVAAEAVALFHTWAEDRERTPQKQRTSMWVTEETSVADERISLASSQVVAC